MAQQGQSAGHNCT